MLYLSTNPIQLNSAILRVQLNTLHLMAYYESHLHELRNNSIVVCLMHAIDFRNMTLIIRCFHATYTPALLELAPPYRDVRHSIDNIKRPSNHHLVPAL